MLPLGPTPFTPPRQGPLRLRELSGAVAHALKQWVELNPMEPPTPVLAKLLWVTAPCRSLKEMGTSRGFCMGPTLQETLGPQGTTSQNQLQGVSRCRFPGSTYCIKVSEILLSPQGHLVIQMQEVLELQVKVPRLGLLTPVLL